RHRRKDRTERAAPTIQKYLQGSIGGLSASNSTPVPITNENFYQPCVGGPSGKIGPPVCCRKDEILFHASPIPNPGCYTDDDPDGIEVYKEQHQQQASEVQYRSGELCAQLATSVGGLERHSPTVSYGKSYGDVDSGISSSSTSGTSYSSSILYRSITNYQQQQQHPHTSVKEQLNIFGGCHQQQQQHQSRAKPNLFHFRS
uniref:Uncharacterized protein n=1 Tax=Anopheles dirus TaxID=7168 RepID=A0A182MZH5_9DIPT